MILENFSIIADRFTNRDPTLWTTTTILVGWMSYASRMSRNSDVPKYRCGHVCFLFVWIHISPASFGYMLRMNLHGRTKRNCGPCLHIVMLFRKFCFIDVTESHAPRQAQVPKAFGALAPGATRRSARQVICFQSCDLWVLFPTRYPGRR